MSVATAPQDTRTQVVPGAVPSLEWLLQEEPGEDDIIDPEFFDRLRDRPVVEFGVPGWRHPPVRFPMVCTRGRMLTATFTIPLDQARGLLPESDRIRPVRVRPGRALILVFATECQRGGLGSYRELGVALPVLLDCGITPPLLPVLVGSVRPQTWKGFGLSPGQLAVDGDRALEAISNIGGMAKPAGGGQIGFHDGGA